MTRYSGLLLLAVYCTYIAPGTSTLTLKFEPGLNNKLGAVNISIQMFNGSAPFTPLEAEPYKCQGYVVDESGWYECSSYTVSDDLLNKIEKLVVRKIRLQYERKNDGKETAEPEAVLTQLAYFDTGKYTSTSDLSSVDIKMRDGSVLDIYRAVNMAGYGEFNCTTAKCDGKNQLCQKKNVLTCQCSDGYRPASDLTTEGELRCELTPVTFQFEDDDKLGAVNISIQLFNGSTPFTPLEAGPYKCQGTVSDAGKYECAYVYNKTLVADIDVAKFRLQYERKNDGKESEPKAVLSEIDSGNGTVLSDLKVTMRDGSVVDIYKAMNAKLDCTTAKCDGKNHLCQGNEDLLTCQCSDGYRPVSNLITEGELRCDSTPIVQSALLLISVLIWGQFF